MNLNEKLNIVSDESLGGFNDSEIHKHWDNTIGKKLLEHDETVRLVIMPSKESKIAKSSNIVTGGWADKEQIRSADQLINRLRQVQADDIPGAIGFALSAGVYNHLPNTSPGYRQLKYIQNMIIDVDAHVNNKTKERFNLTAIDPKYLKLSAISVLNYININMQTNGLPMITPVYSAVTGGGYQFCVRFSEPLNAETSRSVFETYGSILGFSYSASDLISSDTTRQDKAKTEQDKEKKILDTTKTVNNAFDKEEEQEDYAYKKKKGINVLVKSELTGEWFNPFMELDNSFKDCTHAQRIPGTINQKYDAFAYIDNDLISGKDFDLLIDSVKKDIYGSVTFGDAMKKQLVDSTNATNLNFKQSILNSNPDCIYTKQNGDFIKSLSGIIQVANSPQRLQGNDFLSLTEVEKQVLDHFVDYEDANKTLIMVKNVLMDLGIQIVKDSSNYIACRSPFRTDNKPSLAVYLNHNRANIKDFTEDKSYTLISLWMQINDCSKTDAIEQMSYKYGIQLDKSIKRDFEKLQTSENVLELIQEVNTLDYIYYRKANKTRHCIWKDVKTSNQEVFDGYKVLADHVLINQLGIKHPEKQFKENFQEAFQQHILVDAFERFEPGEEKLMLDGHKKYVNIWSASESYLKCWAEAEQLEHMSIDEALALIKDICPNIYVYLLQITQRGSLEYFVNWLSCLANFIYVPTIPIFPSIEGAGKNLFANEILTPYIGSRYIQVVNGQALANNFNSFMGETNLIIIDEGNFTVAKEFDQVKLLTGNETVRVEKKGIDVVTAPRRFNFCMFTNGPDPIRHTITDRRCVYFKLDKKLTQTLAKLNIPSWKDLVKEINKEVHKFWGVIIKTKRNPDWEHNNIQNGQYHHQILLTHPFGKLVLKMLENDWDSISLQLNERQKEIQEEKLNMTLLKEIKNAFYNGEPLSLITINKYLDAMSWKSSMSIQEFISKNELQKNGIKIVVDSDAIKLKIEAEKLQEYVYQENNLARIIPEYSVGKIKSLDTLRKEHEASHNSIINDTLAKTTGDTAGIAKLHLGAAPGMPGNLPSGLPGGMPAGGMPPKIKTQYKG